MTTSMKAKLSIEQNIIEVQDRATNIDNIFKTLQNIIINRQERFRPKAV